MTTHTTPHYKLTIYSRLNLRRGQCSTNGIIERISKYVPMEQITTKGVFVYVICYNRDEVTKISKRIDTYTGCRVPRQLEFIK